jgi:hypothetical protein
MSHTVIAPPGARPATGRSAAGRATAGALLAVLLLAVFAAHALALPPGGPNEQRGTATLSVTRTFVPPVGASGTDPGIVAFTGQGFAANEVLVVKLDDGDVRPTTVPTTPPGGVPNASDGFAWVTADASGAISGSIDLSQTREADKPKVAAGKHHIRLISSNPRSIHADFVVSSLATGPTKQVGSSAAWVGPAADQPVSWLTDHVYDDIPSFVPGSLIPYRVTGYPAGQTVSVKIDNGGTDNPMNPPSPVVDPLTGGNLPADVWHRFVVAADGTASGVFVGPTGAAAGGAHLVRFLGAVTSTGGTNNTSHWAPFAIAGSAAARTVDLAASGQRGRSVALAGSGLLKSAFYLAGGPGNTGDGQTVTARLDGTGTPFYVRANNDGTLTGELPIPADTALGTHEVVLYVGFRAGSDFPQAVYRRSFEVTEFVPDPVETTPTTTTPAADPPSVVPPSVLYVAPTPTPPVKERAAKVAATVLKATRTGRVSLSVARGTVARKASITVKTKGKVRVGNRKRIVTLVKATTATLKAGTAQQRTVLRLKLTAEGRALLKRVTKVRVVVRVAPRGAKAFTRTVWLRG